MSDRQLPPDFPRATPYAAEVGEYRAPSPPRRARDQRPLAWVVVGFVIIAAAVPFFVWRGSRARAHRGAASAVAAATPVSAVADSASASAPSDSTDVRMGIHAFEIGQMDDATRLLTAAMHAHPMSAAPHIYLGQIALARGDIINALGELHTATQLEPGNPLAHRALGEALLVGGSDLDARRALTTSILLDPGDMRTAGYLGCALARTGSKAESERFLERAGPGPWVQCAHTFVRKAPKPAGN